MFRRRFDPYPWIGVVAAVLMGLAAFSSNVAVARANTVTFADPLLEGAVRTALWIPPVEPVTDSEMLQLSTLNLPYYSGASSLEGLQYAKNLTSLTIDDNRIADLAPLSGLTKLTTLSMYGCGVADLSPLANLTALTTLEAGSNQIWDLSPLSRLTKLTTLYAQNNQLWDLSPLLGLSQLRSLYIQNNHIRIAPGTNAALVIQKLQSGGTSVFADSQTPPLPQTRLTFAPAVPASGWTSATVSVSLDATEHGGPGVIGTAFDMYSWQSNNQTGRRTTTVPAMLSAEGRYVMSCSSVDASGYVEATHTVFVGVDKTAPITTFAQSPFSTSCSFSVSDFSGASSIRWVLDGVSGDSDEYGPSIDPSLGPHTISYSSVDMAGNVEATHSAVFTVRDEFYTAMSLSGKPSGRVGQTYRLTGKITANAGGKVGIALARLVGGKWKKAGTATARLSGAKFSYFFNPKQKGSWRVTVTYAGQTLPTKEYKSCSAVKRLTVR